MLETKCTKSNGKSQISLSFLSSTVNDIRTKLNMVGTYLNVEKRAKRVPDPTVETTQVQTNNTQIVIFVQKRQFGICLRGIKL